MRSVCHFHNSAASEKKEAATTVAQLVSMCAVLIRRGEPLPCWVAPHRGLAPSWCRHDAADRVASPRRTAMVSHWLRASETVEFRCGSCRMPGTTVSVSSDTFDKLLEASPSTFFLDFDVRFDLLEASVNLESRLV